MKRTVYQLATIFLTWIVAIPAAWALDFAVLYSGKNTVDLSVGTLYQYQKFELYLGAAGSGTILHTWDTRQSPSLVGQDVYFADTGSGGSYQLLTYGWQCDQDQECGWGEPYMQSIDLIDCTVESGILHNDIEWLAKLRRDPVEWVDVNYSIKNVVLADGRLAIRNAAILFDTANNKARPFDVIVDVRNGASIAAIDSSFHRPGEQTSDRDFLMVNTLSANAPLSWFVRCTFDNIAVRGQSRRIQFEDDKFTDSYIYLNDATKDTTIVGNEFFSGDGFNDIFLSSSDDVVIRSNVFSDTRIYSSGANRLLLEDNTATVSENGQHFINFEGSDSTIKRNSGPVDVSFSGSGNLIAANTFDKIFLSDGSENSVENNVADMIGLFGYQSVNQLRSNIVRGNTVFHIEFFGAPTTEGNTIEDNAISCKDTPFANDMERTGIYMMSRHNPEETSTSTAGNAIRGNRIDACLHGIRLLNWNNNTVRDNDISDTVADGIRLENASSNSIIGNLVTRPGSSGIYLASESSCDRYNYCDPATSGSKENVLAFNGVSGAKRDGIEFSGYGHGNAENGVHENILRNNARYGIYIGGGGDYRNLNNMIYNNIIENNLGGNAADTATNQTVWNKAEPEEINSNIVGGSHLAGNFWGDYAGADANRDGLGDSPYIIKAASGSDPAVQDALPLVKIEPGDINGDGHIDLADAMLALQAAAGLNPAGIRIAADVNGDGMIGAPEAIYIVQRLTQQR